MSEIMDNFALNVRARTKESFGHAMAIAFAAAPGKKATHWVKHPDFGLILFWHGKDEDKFHGKNLVPFPHELDAVAATAFVWDWIQESDHNKFRLKGMDALYNDGDVSCEKAWRVYVEEWGHVGDSSYAVAAILPAWAWLGK